MNHDTTADASTWRWVIPSIPVSELINGVAHKYKLPPGDLPIDYREPACGISTMLNEDSTEDGIKLKCGDCMNAEE
jgi:hypothetical protein